MFESDDFDFDDDSLKVIDERVEEYYSQQIAPETEIDPPSKRQKIESLESDLFGDINFDDESDFAENTRNSRTPSPEAPEAPESAEVSSRKKRILEIFQTSTDSSHLQNASQQKAQFSPPSTTENLEATRKKLALEILKKGSSNQSPLNSSQSAKNRKPPSSIEKNIGNSKSPEFFLKKSHGDVFKKPTERPIGSPGKFAARKSPKFTSPRTLIRKFPGPAGLIPDASESIGDQVNFLKGLDDSDVDENDDDSKISEFCSQNTGRLFSSGAWRSMLDDLPANFLRGHEIATIKRTTRNPKNQRISFVAGVVERIDHSVDNPRLILKDMTDSIEATMHSDIPLTYPNVLQPGVVILLRDAGLLAFIGSKKCSRFQFHIMIALRNILAVYSEKTRLVSSPWMESVKKSEGTFNDFEENDDGGESATTEESASSIRNPKILAQRNPFSDSNMEFSDFEIDDDDMAFACSNLSEIKDTQSVAIFSKSGPTNPVKSPFFKNMENKEEKISQPFEVNQRKKSPKMVARKSPKDGRSPKNIEKMDESRSQDSPVMKGEIRPKTITGLRSRLLQFRSNDVLTPPVTDAKVEETPPPTSSVTSNLIEKTQETSDSIMGSFGDDLLASDNDTDDEILSQLDVDSIMTNSGS